MGGFRQEVGEGREQGQRGKCLAADHPKDATSMDFVREQHQCHFDCRTENK